MLFLLTDSITNQENIRISRLKKDCETSQKRKFQTVN